MWRNAVVLDLVGWLREHNERGRDEAGFYGLDLYRLYRSIHEVIAYLEGVNPAAAERARPALRVLRARQRRGRSDHHAEIRAALAGQPPGPRPTSLCRSQVGTSTSNSRAAPKRARSPSGNGRPCTAPSASTAQRFAHVVG